MGLMDTLKSLVRAADGDASADQLDRPNLRREVVGGLLALKRRGHRGVEALPPAATVTITVGAGSLEVVRRFVDDPLFDQEIDAELLNRLVGARQDALPIRRYIIQAGSRTAVVVAESSGGVSAWIALPDGAAVPLSAERREYRLGRGPQHGDAGLPNDICLDDALRFVSRRAAIIERAGSGLMLRALDQGECLLVVRPDGSRTRPANTRSRRVRLMPGDQIELTDGAAQSVCLSVLEAAPTPTSGEE